MYIVKFLFTLRNMVRSRLKSRSDCFLLQMMWMISLLMMKADQSHTRKRRSIGLLVTECTTRKLEKSFLFFLLLLTFRISTDLFYWYLRVFLICKRLQLYMGACNLHFMADDKGNFRRRVDRPTHPPPIPLW